MTRRSAILLGVCLSACTSSSNHVDASPGSATVTPTTTHPAPPAQQTLPSGPGVQTLSCNDAHVEEGPPGSEVELVLGVVALSTSPSHQALGIARQSSVTGPALFAKDGLVIQAEAASFELEVVTVPGISAAIAWGNYSASHRRVVVPSCPDAGGTGWLWYPGGYFTDKPVCLPLIVRAGGQEQEVHVGVGTACPGQQAPPSV